MTAAPLRGVHVAVVGDNPGTLTCVDESLRAHGALVSAHDSMRTLRRLMQVLLVNVLVIDVGDGSEASLARIRAVRAWPPAEGGKVPIIALFAGPADAEALVVAEDIDSLVRTPMEDEELVHIIVSVFAASSGSARDDR